MTWNSNVDNLRPVIPIWDDQNTAILWLRGSMKTYTDWNAEVMLVAAKHDAGKAADAWNALAVEGQDAAVIAAPAPDQDHSDGG